MKINHLLLKNATVISSATKPQKADILVRNGTIEAIGAGLQAPEGVEVRDLQGAWVMPGWLDLGTHICDPGFEHREDMRSALAAAKAGGFTSIAVMPDTSPVVDTKSQVRYLIEKSAGMGVEVLPIGALSVHLDGKDMAELMDMHAAGAVAFSDSDSGTQDAGLLMRALQYSTAFGGLVMNHPHHQGVARGGEMHEGVMSTSLGMKGIPVLAETLMLQRDLSILAYTGGRLHVHLISTAESVDLIRKAKAEGLSVTCSVAIANLCFTDAMLADFDSNYKVLPPVRGDIDRQALIQGLKDGVIDLICTAHTPWHQEAKDLEFPYADFGMTGLETAFSLCMMYLAEVFTPTELAKFWSDGPRRVLGKQAVSVSVGSPFDQVSVFDPKASWKYDAQTVQSKSVNHPLFGTQLTGRAL